LFTELQAMPENNQFSTAQGSFSLDQGGTKSDGCTCILQTVTKIRTLSV